MKRLSLILVGLLLAWPVHASYESNGFAENLQGALATPIGTPVTIAVWVKKTDWTSTNNDVALTISEDRADKNSSVTVQGNSPGDLALAFPKNASGNDNGGAIVEFTAGSLDNTWVCLVGVFAGDSDRDVYIVDSTQTTNSAVTNALTAVMDEITVGTSSVDSGTFDGLVAEVAIWDVAISVADVDSFCAGDAASGINSANLLGYWPLDVDQATHPDESGNGGPSLVENGGIVFSADHPTITEPGAGITPLAAKYYQDLSQ